MKKMSLFLSFLMCTSVLADSNTSSQRLAAIKTEMSVLLEKRAALLKKHTDEERREVNEEVTSMPKMLDSRWGDFVSKLKNAKGYETMVKEDEEELHKIDQRLEQLAAEIKGLSNNNLPD
jgi:hypothetical protein